MKRVWVVIMAGAALLGIVAAFLAWSWYVIDVQQQMYVIKVSDDGVAGLNADTDALRFGSAPPGGVAERKAGFVSVVPARMVIRAEGDASSWISVSRNELVVAPHEYTEVIFRAHPPLDAIPGNYTGNITVTFYRPFPWQ